MIKNVQHDTTSKTVLDYGNHINANLNCLNGKGRVLSIASDFTVVGLNDNPFLLFATPVFNIKTAPSIVQKKIFKVRWLTIQPSYQYDDLQNNYCKIPSWIQNFKHLSYLKINHVDISDLTYLKNSPIIFLRIENIKLKEEEYHFTLNQINKLNHLQGVIIDSTVSKKFIEILEKQSRYKLYFTNNKLQMQEFEKALSREIR